MSDRDILTELRAVRDEFARSHGYDLAAMGAALRARDAAVGARVVRGEPRRPVPGAPRAARVDRAKFEEALSKVADVEPEERDRL